jgi:hypothetical protein
MQPLDGNRHQRGDGVQQMMLACHSLCRQNRQHHAAHGHRRVQRQAHQRLALAGHAGLFNRFATPVDTLGQGGITKRIRVVQCR